MPQSRFEPVSPCDMLLPLRPRRSNHPPIPIRVKDLNSVRSGAERVERARG